MADKIYKVKNRSAGVVIYRIPEDNIRREFMPGETKMVTMTELEKAYSERFVSRINGVAQKLDFLGEDVRIKKK